MSIFSKIKSLFKKQAQEQSTRKAPVLVQRNTDGKYAIRWEDDSGQVMYMKFRIHDQNKDTEKVEQAANDYEWQLGKYQSGYEHDGYYCLWTTDREGLKKLLNYKETIVGVIE